MRRRLAFTAPVCLLLTCVLHAQQVVFSHRAYRPQERSYQQLWMWSADTGMLTQISHAERDHLFPACEADGRHVIFEDRTFSEKGLPATRWRLDRASRLRLACRTT